MISEWDFSQWLGVPWEECETWLHENNINYEKKIWQPDERSQFLVDLSRCYVMRFQSKSPNLITVYIAGKMVGRKE
jgi:hypothetical protein